MTLLFSIYLFFCKNCFMEKRHFYILEWKLSFVCDKSLILHIFGRRTQLSTRIRQVFYQLKRIPNDNQPKWTQAAVQQSITTTIMLSNKPEQVAADAADSTVARCTVIRGEHHTAKLTFTPAQQCNIHYRKKHYLLLSENPARILPKGVQADLSGLLFIWFHTTHLL